MLSSSNFPESKQWSRIRFASHSPALFFFFPGCSTPLSLLSSDRLSEVRTLTRVGKTLLVKNRVKAPPYLTRSVKTNHSGSTAKAEEWIMPRLLPFLLTSLFMHSLQRWFLSLAAESYDQYSARLTQKCRRQSAGMHSSSPVFCRSIGLCLSSLLVFHHVIFLQMLLEQCIATACLSQELQAH